jgi:hypothetical protein
VIHRTDDHVPFRWLADRADGLLPAGPAGEADAHLASGCAPCRARDRSVRRLVAAIAAGPLETPPAAADRRVVSAFVRSRAPRAADLDALFGTLVLDQRADLLMAVRSSGADVRRLLWTVGAWEVDASVVASGAGTDLLGQAVRAEETGDGAVTGEVRARRGRRVAATAPVAADGRFTFRGLAPGAWTLEGVLDGRAFVLPLLVLD